MSTSDWLNRDYFDRSYENKDTDPDILKRQRRKAIDELKSLIRERREQAFIEALNSAVQ